MDPVNITALLTAKGTPKHFWLVDDLYVIDYPMLAGKHIKNKYCASEDASITTIGKGYGYKPIVMPEKYGKPSSQHVDHINYAVDQMDEKPDILVVILGNNVCIKPEWIDKCVERIKGTLEETTAIVPAYKDQDHHPMRAMYMNDWGCLQSAVASKDISSNRQELPDNYFMCHNFWVVKWPVREQGTGPWYFLGANVRPHLIDDYGTQDIHEKEDLIRATEWVRTNA